MKTTFHRLEESSLGTVELVPQAIVAVSVRKFQDDIGLIFSKGHDDLDNYSAMFFRVDERICAFIHHDGEPDDGMTLYLERNLMPKEVNGIISKILDEYGIDRKLVTWRETEDLRRKK